MLNMQISNSFTEFRNQLGFQKCSKTKKLIFRYIKRYLKDFYPISTNGQVVLSTNLLGH